MPEEFPVATYVGEWLPAPDQPLDEAGMPIPMPPAIEQEATA